MDEENGLSILLNENTKVSYDGLNYVIARKAITKTGVERWINESFFPNIEMMCQEIIDTMPGLEDENIKDLKTLIKAHNKLEKEVLKMVSKMVNFEDNEA